MKLSEAILLGSTIVKPKAGALRFSGENAGCALGMAAIASGCTFSPSQRKYAANDRRTANVENVWGPWLLRVVVRPCDCRTPIELKSVRLKEIISYLLEGGSGALPRGMRIKDIIAHLFDDHVMGKRDWTLEQLAGWVERWEPREREWYRNLAEASRKSRSSPPSPDFSEDVAEWQKTRRAFEAKVNTKRRRRTDET